VLRVDRLPGRDEPVVRLVDWGRGSQSWGCLCVDDPRGRWFCLPLAPRRGALSVGLPRFVDELGELQGQVLKPSARREPELRGLLLDYYAAGREGYVNAD
jgi:hypothetical protein